MKTSKELQLSISALTLIKQSKTPLSSGILAEKTGSTTAFLGQIMKKLRKSELVYAKNGPRGGYVFNYDRREVNAYDIAVALDYEFAPFISGNASTAERLDSEIIAAFVKIKI